MPRYRVMCHPQGNGKPDFFTIETSYWGFMWTPMGRNLPDDTFSLATFGTQEEATDKVLAMFSKAYQPYAVAYFPPTPLPPR